MKKKCLLPFTLGPGPTMSITMPMSNGHHIVAIVKLNGYVRPVLCYDKYKFCPWPFSCDGLHWQEQNLLSKMEIATNISLQSSGGILSASDKVLISGLGPDRDQCPNMVPIGTNVQIWSRKSPDLPLKSQSCLIGHNRTVYRSQTVKIPSGM